MDGSFSLQIQGWRGRLDLFVDCMLEHCIADIYYGMVGSGHHTMAGSLSQQLRDPLQLAEAVQVF